jgi:hypothetical protein
MKKISDMVLQTKLKIRQRGRLRTTTKLAILFGVSSIASITIALIFLFNLSDPKELYGDSYKPVAETGQIEVPKQKLLTSFEVKELDGKNTAFANDTSVQYKKLIPVSGQ